MARYLGSSLYMRGRMQGKERRGEDLKSGGGNGGGKGERGARGQGKLRCVEREGSERGRGHLGGSGPVRKLTSQIVDFL